MRPQLTKRISNGVVLNYGRKMAAPVDSVHCQLSKWRRDFQLPLSVFFVVLPAFRHFPPIVRYGEMNKVEDKSYDKWSRSQVREELRRRGKKLSGRKKELIER